MAQDNKNINLEINNLRSEVLCLKDKLKTEEDKYNKTVEKLVQKIVFVFKDTAKELFYKCMENEFTSELRYLDLSNKEIEILIKSIGYNLNWDSVFFDFYNLYLGFVEERFK